MIQKVTGRRTMISENKHWVITVGLDSSGTTARRQELYDAFRVQLYNRGLDVELKQTGLMGIDRNEALVEVSSPEGERVYYGLATPDQVERIINGHLTGGKPVTELVIPADEIDSLFVKQGKNMFQSCSAFLNDTRFQPSVLNLIGIGWILGISIFAGMLGGLWLDSRLNTGHLFTMIGLILGIIIAFFGAYRLLLPLVRSKGGAKTIGAARGLSGLWCQTTVPMEFKKVKPMPTQQSTVDYVTEAKKRRQKLMNYTKQTEKRMSQITQEEFKEDLEAIITRARVEIGRERDDAIGEIRREFADLTMLAAGRGIDHSLDKKKHRQSTDQVLEKKSSLKQSQFGKSRTKN